MDANSRRYQYILRLKLTGAYRISELAWPRVSDFEKLPEFKPPDNAQDLGFDEGNYRIKAAPNMDEQTVSF